MLEGHVKTHGEPEQSRRQAREPPRGVVLYLILNTSGKRRPSQHMSRYHGVTLKPTSSQGSSYHLFISLRLVLPEKGPIKASKSWLPQPMTTLQELTSMSLQSRMMLSSRFCLLELLSWSSSRSFSSVETKNAMMSPSMVEVLFFKAESDKAILMR